MAIANYADFVSSLREPQIISFSRSVTNRFAGSHAWTSQTLPTAGTAPSTAVACNNTTVGAYNRESGVGGEAGVEWILARHSLNTSAGSPFIMVNDRLSHQGGLSGIVTGTQTTNLPTAALTRYTSGEGVMICLDIYTAIGTTISTATVTYTNQAGVAGRVSQPFLLGGVGFNAASSRIYVPLQNGDTGARSVESVDIVTNTGTAGNFGVTLIKPLVALMPPVAGTEAFGTNIGNSLIGCCGQSEPFLEGCCIETSGFAGSTITVAGMLGFIRK